MLEHGHLPLPGQLRKLRLPIRGLLQSRCLPAPGPRTLSTNAARTELPQAPVLAGGGRSVPQIRHGRVSVVMGFRSPFRIAKLSSLNPAGAMFSSRSAIYAPFIGECFG